MFLLMSKAVSAILLSAVTLANPTTPKALSFDASAFVTANNKVRLSIAKTTDETLVVLLRNNQHDILFRQVVPKKEYKSALLFSISDLTDGQYEIEVKSKEGSIRKQIKLATTPTQGPSRSVAMQ